MPIQLHLKYNNLFTFSTKTASFPTVANFFDPELVDEENRDFFFIFDMGYFSLPWSEYGSACSDTLCRFC
jgi:hypothetical protein